MQFCDECGSMMKPADGRMHCSNDDCAAEAGRDHERAAEFVSTESQIFDDVIESDDSVNFEGKPTASVTCEECGHDTAWYTIRQTASADEPPTRFYMCQECKRVWRGYN